jgi:ATP-dependent Clp protease protease subunit
MSKNEDSISDIHTSNIDVENRIIYLQEKEDTSDSPGVDFRMVQNFTKNINILQNQASDPITVYLQTIGGCWWSGMGVYDVIKLCKCKVTIIGYAQICSMGTVIMQAADRRILMPNCVFMCHYGSSEISGDYLSSQNEARIEKEMTNKMVEIYAEKCHRYGSFFINRGDSLGKVKTYIKRKLKDGDWYLNADQALDYGFIDKIMSKNIKL